MQSLPRKIVVLGTGGTIAGEAASPADDLGYRAATLPVAALLGALPAPPGVALESEQVAQLDSKDMDFATWRRLAMRIAHHAARPEVAGIVVTHGSDTLEETAYFLARTVPLAKPVVLTAAMRPASSREADGPRNLADAIAIAARGRPAGVVAVLAGEVHAGRSLRKVHSRDATAFGSGEDGPLARIDGDTLVPLRPWPADEALGLAVLPDDPAGWPAVDIVVSGAGVDGRAVRALADAGVDGLVVAATGNGTLHLALEAELRRAAARGIALLRSSRCARGGIVEADSAQASQAPALPSAGDLTPVQARIELLLRLLAARRAPAQAGSAAGGSTAGARGP